MRKISITIRTINGRAYTRVEPSNRDLVELRNVLSDNVAQNRTITMDTIEERPGEEDRPLFVLIPVSSIAAIEVCEVFE